MGLVYGVCNSAKSCQVVQNKAIRYFLGVHRFAPTAAIHSETGWVNSKFRRQINIVRLWNRLCTMEKNRLTKKIFRWDKQKNHENWSSDLSGLLENLGYDNEYFENESLCDIDIVKSKLQDLSDESWGPEILAKPKLRTYRSFKTNCDVESYVNKYMPKYDRSLLCQFRIGILPLRIETGRYKTIRDANTGRYRNLSPEERTCEICQFNEIEDEFHFLCKCSAYSRHREILFNKVEGRHVEFQALTLRQKFDFLMKKCNLEVSKYLKSAWDVRKSLMYN